MHLLYPTALRQNGTGNIHLLTGVAGEFTIKQILMLADCMPGGIKYEEADGKVSLKDD